MTPRGAKLKHFLKDLESTPRSKKMEILLGQLDGLCNIFLGFPPPDSQSAEDLSAKVQQLAEAEQ